MLKFILDFTNIKVAHNLQIMIKYTILCRKFHTACWFSQYVFTDFCKILVSVANLWLQWMNECSSTMNVVDIFSMSKMKVKQKRPMFAIYSLFNNMSDFSAE